MSTRFGKIADDYFIVDPDVTSDHGLSTEVGGIQWALEAMEGAGSGFIQLVPGTYNTSGIGVDNPNVTIKGAGYATQLTIDHDTDDHNLLEIKNIDCTIDGMTFTRTGAAYEKALLDIEIGAHRASVRNCFFENHARGAIEIEGYDSRILYNYFGQADPGISYTRSLCLKNVSGGGTSPIIAGNMFINASKGTYIYFFSLDRTMIINNIFHSDQGFCKFVHLDSCHGSIVNNNMAFNENTVTPSYPYFHFEDQNVGSFSGNVVRGNGINASDGIGFEFNGCERIMNTGNNTAHLYRPGDIDSSNDKIAFMGLLNQRYIANSTIWSATDSFRKMYSY